MNNYYDSIDVEASGDDARLEISWGVFAWNISTNKTNYHSSFSFRVRLFELIEYEPAVGAPTNGFSSDSTVCQTTSIDGSMFKWKSKSMPHGNTTLTKITGTDGLLSLVSYIPVELEEEIEAHSFELNGTTINPRTFKFDIDLNLEDYDWSSKCKHPRLALVALFKSDFPIDHTARNLIHFGEAEIEDYHFTIGLFSFTPNVTVNHDIAVPLISSSLKATFDADDEVEDESLTFVSRAIFSFDSVKPKSIHWDPIMSAPIQRNSALSISLATVAALLSLSLLF